jgi:hypothetical protein
MRDMRYTVRAVWEDEDVEVIFRHWPGRAATRWEPEEPPVVELVRVESGGALRRDLFPWGQDWLDQNAELAFRVVAGVHEERFDRGVA